jgi:type IV pilus assembly protein PilE
MRGSIPEATTELAKIKSVRESYFQDHYSYAGAPCPKDNKHFSFQCTVAPDPSDPAGVATLDPDETYLVVAKGIGAMAGFEYTINEMLGKTSKTPWGTSSSCWITRTDGSC